MSVFVREFACVAESVAVRERVCGVVVCWCECVCACVSLCMSVCAC